MRSSAIVAGWAPPLFPLLFQVQPGIPDKITDQGLLLAAFILLLLFVALWLLLTKGPALIAAWRGGNGHRAHTDGLAALQADLKVTCEMVRALDHDLRADYHDRLVPALHGQSLAYLRLSGMGDLAKLEEERVAALRQAERRS